MNFLFDVLHPKRMDDSFNELFKGLTLYKDCQSDLWEPLKCTYVGNHKRLILDVRIKIIDSSKVVLQSVPIRRAIERKDNW